MGDTLLARTVELLIFTKQILFTMCEHPSCLFVHLQRSYIGTHSYVAFYLFNKSENATHFSKL